LCDFKKNLQGSDIDTVRELAVEAKKQGLTPINLASSVRLNNYIVKSGAAEDEIETFIANIHSSSIPPEKAVEYVNQLFAVSRSELIPIDQGKIRRKAKD